MKFINLKEVMIFWLIIMLINFVGAVDFEIKGVVPDKAVVSLSVGENQIFSIDNGQYESIKWYVDSKLIKEGVVSFDLNDFESGVYVVRVDVIKGTSGDSNTWNVVITGDRLIEKIGISGAEIIFYVFLTVLSIIIILVVRLFILEKKKIVKASLIVE